MVKITTLFALLFAVVPVEPTSVALALTAAQACAAAAGASDLYKGQASQAFLTTSKDQEVRAFAPMLKEATTAEIEMAARPDGRRPSPAALERTKGAVCDPFHPVQQVKGGRHAFAPQKRDATAGDRPARRGVAAKAVPIVEHHLATVSGLARQ